MIKIVVFDMDGVLCRYRIERRLARLVERAKPRGDPRHHLALEVRGRGEHGVMSADDYLWGFGERLGVLCRA
ncbi:MAG: hypothetical protein ACREYC_23085 [Gammaproteobacteria bacterium]